MRGFLVDMNLSPAWCPVLEVLGLPVWHWVDVGLPNAADSEIMHYAREHDYVVVTHDLDFGHLLALTGAVGPSCVQLRTQNVDPSSMGDFLVEAIRQTWSLLEAGALVTVDPVRFRATILPLRPAHEDRH